MTLTMTEVNGVRFVEGQPDQAFLRRWQDATELVGACGEHAAAAALLYPANLTPKFFDLSSGEAGEILQKLQNYRLRLAVVCPPGSVQFSTHFRDLLAEVRLGREFGVFETRTAALAWLGAHPASHAP